MSDKAKRPLQWSKYRSAGDCCSKRVRSHAPQQCAPRMQHAVSCTVEHTVSTGIEQQHRLSHNSWLRGKSLKNTNEFGSNKSLSKQMKRDIPQLVCCPTQTSHQLVVTRSEQMFTLPRHSDIRDPKQNRLENASNCRSEQIGKRFKLQIRYVVRTIPPPFAAL